VRNKAISLRLISIWARIAVLVLLGHSMAHGAQKAELWARWQKSDAASRQKIDHSVWDGFLKKIVVAPHPSGINRVRYQAVTAEDFKNLQDYLK
jgi:hypothetical protein